MKTTVHNITNMLKVSLMTLLISLVTSCKSDNLLEEIPTTGGENTLTGNLTSDLTLNSSTQYTITSAFIVKDGATLNIPAGTVLVSKSGTGNFIGVEQGGKINVQGTANAPVIMRSQLSEPGDWGGLVICGKATTTEGVNAVAEIGGLIYGGTEDTDDSGSIQYLVIKGAGAQINSESQYNGLSLYAVGSGTTIKNVAVIDGADDGVEFFGGTVSATNLYFENNEDDSVDWTEGWNGTITNTYVSHTISGFSTAVEADGVNNNPKIVNFTAVSTVDGTALQFKKQSGATITGLHLSGYATNIDMKDNGPLENIQIEGADAELNATYNETPLDISSWTWFK